MVREVIENKDESKNNISLTIYSLIDIIERDIEIEVSERNFIEYLYTSKSKYDFGSKEYYDFAINFNKMPESSDAKRAYVIHKNIEANYLVKDNIDFKRTHEKVIDRMDDVLDKTSDIEGVDINDDSLNSINEVALKDTKLSGDIYPPKDNIDYLDALLADTTIDKEDEFESSDLTLNKLSEEEERVIFDLIKAIDSADTTIDKEDEFENSDLTLNKLSEEEERAIFDLIEAIDSIDVSQKESDEDGLSNDSQKEKLKDTSAISSDQQDEKTDEIEKVENADQGKKNKNIKRDKKTKKKQKIEKTKKDKKKKVKKKGKNILRILFNLVVVIVLIMIIATATFFIYDSRVRDEQFLLNMSVIIVSFGFLLDRVRRFFT